jgi:serine/threonine protein kinase
VLIGTPDDRICPQQPSRDPSRILPVMRGLPRFAQMPDTIDRLNNALEGRYRIERKLGEGGMAVVYLTDDLRHGRQVALKVLKPELAAAVGADRFLREIKTTANLQHPHIRKKKHPTDS